MFGYRLNSNDYIVLFENSDLKALENETVKGKFCMGDLQYLSGLEVMISENVDLVKSEFESNILRILMGNCVYDTLVGKGLYQAYEQRRHIFLMDLSLYFPFR